MFYYYIQKLTKKKKIKIDKVMSSQSGGSKKKRVSWRATLLVIWKIKNRRILNYYRCRYRMILGQVKKKFFYKMATVW